MINVERLTKSYGQHAAVRDVSFAVAKGQIVGFLGPNGAGKSTTMKILAGYLAASSGRVRVGGHDLQQAPELAKAQLGYMPEAVPLYPEMRVVEYLRFRAELKGVPRKLRAQYVEQAMEQSRVVDVAHATIGHLSKGYKQRVGLADALVAKPPVLILDEPTAGLDPNQIREVRDVLRSLGADYTVLLSTHILSEVEATCGRAIVIDRGRVLAQGTLDEIREQHGPRALRVACRAQVGALKASLEKIAGVRIVQGPVAALDDASVCRATVAPTDRANTALGALAEEVSRVLAAQGVPLRELAPVASSLEDVFARLTRRSATLRAPQKRESAGSSDLDGPDELDELDEPEEHDLAKETDA